MARLIRFFAFMIVGFAAVPALAQDGDFDTWREAFIEEAIGEGISSDTAHDALDGIEPDEHIVALDQKQPETTITFESYAARNITPERIEQGRELLNEHRALLNEITEIYGVPPEIIVSLWGIESRFGANSGDHEVITSLASLAFEGRRAVLFRNQLMNALRILDQEHMQPSALLGSWAGAMGQPQFMPLTYIRYAVDFDRDGKRDIWESTPDVFASIANYLAAEGWSGEWGWGREVTLPGRVEPRYIGLDNKHTLASWVRGGARNPDGSSPPLIGQQVSLIQPDGPDGRSFLVYDNYRALMRWNRSTYFATTVGLLADRIK